MADRVLLEVCAVFHQGEMESRVVFPGFYSSPVVGGAARCAFHLRSRGSSAGPGIEYHRWHPCSFKRPSPSCEGAQIDLCSVSHALPLQ